MAIERRILMKTFIAMKRTRKKVNKDATKHLVHFLMVFLRIGISNMILFPMCSFANSYEPPSQRIVLNIRDFGAKGDAQTINTSYIQAAIDKANKLANDGPLIQKSVQVIIPAGRFLTGPIKLKSNVTLHLLKDAVILGTTNRIDYGEKNLHPLISANNATNVAIIGSGCIDGQGAELVKNLISLLRKGILSDNFWRVKRPGENNRPMIIGMKGCKKIKIVGINIKNSACWVQDYDHCEDVLIDSIQVVSTDYWNNDGIDIVNCKNFTLSNSFFDVADDGICLKSEGDSGTCENVFVTNCKIRSSASGFKLGTGSYGGFKNIYVKGLIIYDTYRTAISLETVDGASLENVLVEDVKATNVGGALFIRLGHRNQDNKYSTIKGVVIRNLVATISSYKPDIGYPFEGPKLSYIHNIFPSSITGIPGHDIQDVQLENIKIVYEGIDQKSQLASSYLNLNNVPENEAGYPEFSMFGDLPAWGLFIRHCNGLKLRNLILINKQQVLRPAIVLGGTSNVELKKIGIEYANFLPIIFDDHSEKFSMCDIQFAKDVDSSRAIVIKR